MVLRMSYTRYAAGFRQGKRAQAALEYVHTYGWVLLAMMMIVGVLFYFNISGAEDLIPVECSFLSGINCLDAEVDETYVYLVVLNEFGFTLTNVSLNITGTCNSSANTTDGNPFGNLNVLLPNQKSTYVFECQNLTNMKVAERIVVGYRNLETGQLHIKTGKFQHSSSGSW